MRMAKRAEPAPAPVVQHIPSGVRKAKQPKPTAPKAYDPERDPAVANMTVDIEGDVLTIRVDLSQPGRASATGKTIVVGASGGWFNFEHKGAAYMLNPVNVMRK